MPGRIVRIIGQANGFVHFIRESVTVDEVRQAGSLKLRDILKTFFDVFKNLVAVAAFKAFARTVHSHKLAVIGTILEMLIGIYVFSYLDPIVISRSLKGSGLRAAVYFVGITVIAAGIMGSVNYGTIYLVDLIAKLQTR